MFTKLFWKDFAERLLATLAQVALGLLTADTAASVSWEVWAITLVTAGLGVFVKAAAAAKATTTNAISPASFATRNVNDVP